MKHFLGPLAVLAALLVATSASGAPRALPWGGFEPPGGNEGDVFGMLCKTERGLRDVLEDRGYTHVLLGVVNDDDHRVLAKATRDGVTWHIWLNSCTGKIIARREI